MVTPAPCALRVLYRKNLEPAPSPNRAVMAIKHSTFAFPFPLVGGGFEQWDAADILILKHLTLILKCKQSLLDVITLFHSANMVYYS